MTPLWIKFKVLPFGTEFSTLPVQEGGALGASQIVLDMFVAPQEFWREFQ